MSSDQVTRLADRPEMLRARLRELPLTPGVYLMRDPAGKVIYVGKAANLRNRVRSYFVGTDPRAAGLVPHIFDFEHLVCATEKEALVLENNLIKHYRPRYNVRLKDDKTYLYLRLPLGAEYGRPSYVRRFTEDGARYYGPFTDAKALRGTMKSLRRVFPYRACSDEVFKRGRVCLDYHLKICSGPCEKLIQPTEYRGLMESVAQFLEGRSDELVDQLEARMREAAANQRFESAALHRDRMRSVDKLRQEQKAVSQGRNDQDLVALVRNSGQALARLFFVRGGKLVGTDSYRVEGAADESEPAVMSSFLGQYYGRATHIPREVLVNVEPGDRALLEEWLSERRGARVEVRVPQRGERRRLLGQLEESAQQSLRQIEISRDFDSERTQGLLQDLARQLGLEAMPERIECYDISNIQGTSAVGSMVVFEQGRALNRAYRKFRIRTVEGSNDFAMLREVLRRRFSRFRRTGEAAELAGDESFDRLPDLVLIDGGRGQLSSALEAMTEMGIQVPTFGLAKKREELFRPGQSEPLILPRESEALFLVQRIRDEAHRFAITYHRQLRTARSLTSELERVEGVGPVLRRALLRHFGSVAAIREATLEQLCAVPRINRALALRIKETL